MAYGTDHPQGVMEDWFFPFDPFSLTSRSDTERLARSEHLLLEHYTRLLALEVRIGALHYIEGILDVVRPLSDSGTFPISQLIVRAGKLHYALDSGEMLALNIADAWLWYRAECDATGAWYFVLPADGARIPFQQTILQARVFVSNTARSSK